MNTHLLRKHVQLWMNRLQAQRLAGQLPSDIEDGAIIERWQIVGDAMRGITASFSDDEGDGLIEFGLFERDELFTSNLLNATLVLNDDGTADLTVNSDATPEMNYTAQISPTFVTRLNAVLEAFVTGCQAETKAA